MELVENSVWNLTINGKNYANELTKLESSVQSLKDKQAELTKGTKEWADNKKQIAELEAEYKKIREEMGISGLTVKQLTAVQKELNREIKNLVPGTAEYIEKTKELQEVNTRLQNVREDTKAIKKEVDNSKSTWQNMKEWVTGALSAFSAINAVEFLINFAREGLKMSASLSDSFTSVTKTTGMTKEEIEALNKAIQQIDTRTAHEDLLDIAKVGGQIGVAKEEMLGFVKSVDMAAVALGDEFSGGVEQVATEMGTIKTLFKETKEMDAGTAINKIGSAVNELGAAGTATGPVISEFTRRLGQLGDLSPQISETMGLGAAFQEMGLTAEISAGGLSNILLSASSATVDFADQLGMTEVQFKKLLNSSPNEMILKLAESFKGMPIEDVVANMQDLGIKSQEATKVMLLLSNNTEMVRDKQKLASTAMKEGTSLTKEFSLANENAAAQLDKKEKAVTALKVQLGDFLLPIVLGVTRSLITFIEIIKAIPGFLYQNKELFAALGVAMITFNLRLVAATASSIAHQAVEKARLVWTNSATAAQWALNTAMSMNPIAAVITVVALLVGAFVTLYKNSETVRAGINGVWFGIKQMINEIGNFYRAVVSLDFAKMFDIIKNGASRVTASVAKGYATEMAASQKEVEKNTKTHTATLSKTQLDEQKKLSEGLLTGYDGYLSDKELKEEKKRNRELEKERKHQQKISDEAVKANEDMLDKIDKAWADSIEDEKTAHVVKLQQKYEKELEYIEKSKASESVKATWTKAINEGLISALKKLDDEYTTIRQLNIDKIKNKENDLVDNSATINKNLTDKIKGYNTDKESSWLNTNQKILTDTEQKVSAIGALMAGDLSGFTKAMGDKLSSVQSFKINALNSYMQLYEQVSGMINDQVAKFADAARAMIEIAQTRLQVQFAILDKEKNAATESKREELRDLGQQVDAYDLKIAQLVVQQYATTDKKRQEDLQLEIDKLTKEKNAIVAQKDLTSLEIKQIETNHDNATRSRKLEMWKKQQDLEIKLAKINAIQAYVKALSSGFPPMNWMNAATVMYAAKEQMNLIRAETPPEFSKGGYIRNAGVPKGPSHGSIYGQGGIALMSRETGQEVGEMEGGEPIMILSRNLYANNGPLIDRLLESSLYRNGAPVYQKGGVMGSDGGSYSDYLEPVRYGQMYLFGSRKRKKAQREADSALAEAQALSASMSAENFDASHQMAGMMMENQAVSAENAGLTVEVLNEISEGLGVHLPAIRESIEGGNARMEMMMARMSEQIGVLYGIKGATDRVADNVNMSKRNDL